MKSKFAEPDFSFENAGIANRTTKAIRRQIAEARRSSIKGADPHARHESPWRVKQLADADKTPRWTAAPIKGSPGTHFTEHRPDENTKLFDAPNRPKNASVFELKILRGCGISLGMVAEAGDRVTCFGLTAMELVNSGIAEVIEETRP